MICTTSPWWRVNNGGWSHTQSELVWHRPSWQSPCGTGPLVKRPPFILARLSTKSSHRASGFFYPEGQKWHPRAQSSCFCFSMTLRLHHTALTDRSSYWRGGSLLWTLSLYLKEIMNSECFVIITMLNLQVIITSCSKQIVLHTKKNNIALSFSISFSWVFVNDLNLYENCWSSIVIQQFLSASEHVDKKKSNISNYIVYFIFLPTATQDLVRCDTLHIQYSFLLLLEAESYWSYSSSNTQ